MSQLAGLKEATYWMEPHPVTKDYSNLPLTQKTDVLVVGSGYTGTVAALQLKKAGVDVTLIDQTKIGSEASAKNGGMALNGLSTSLYKVKKKYGTDKMVQFFRESLESINCVEHLVKEGNIDCHFERSGYLEAAYKPAHFEGLKEDQEFLAQHLNHKTILIPREQIHDEIESDYYHGALVDPASAGVHPAKFIAGLIQMADKAGVDLHEKIEAQEILSSGPKSIVRTNKGNIEADQVVIATNGYTTNLTPWQMRRVVPVESFMIATEELPDEIANTLIPKNRMIFDTKRFLYYFRLSPDKKRILFGGRPKQFWKSTVEKAKAMRLDMLKVFPQLEKYAIDYTWFGKVCFTVDRFPIVGERNGIHYAMGYCGHGVGMACYLGHQLANMILKKDESTVFTDKKSIPIPLYTGKPWFLPIAHSYFRLMDRIQ
ncbi:MAG: FAD-binding oxidoreductase [Deltaproteobacteria bacterium]|jgi:glycine/D-amino acid oxidase-like deaminating enzyme|nr:FAD-binding oxidoreductase [Deltaproteobacteria bacterium]